ncbi:MAG: heme A synthase, partial [Marmoricola sp.]
TGARPEAVRAARILLVVEIAQGAIGFVQYFTNLPVVLVGFHMLGAAIIMAVMTWTVLATREV